MPQTQEASEARAMSRPSNRLTGSYSHQPVTSPGNSVEPGGVIPGLGRGGASGICVGLLVCPWGPESRGAQVQVMGLLVGPGSPSSTRPPA